MTVKFINAEQAAALVPDGATVLIDGFISFCLADDILGEIENRYINEGKPENLSVVNIAGIGGDGKNRGINHFAHRGLVRRLLCANLSAAPKIYPLVMDNAFPTFMIPQGVLSHMMRAIASKKPGVISQVGMKTFVDPEVDGGRINQAAWDSGESVVERIQLRGEDFLFYPAFDIDVAIIKGSFSDHQGNISLENEALHLEQVEVAAATKNCGGIVMVQVDEVVNKEHLHAQDVKIPSTMIDYVIVGKPENSKQHFLQEYENGNFIPSWSGHERIELDEIANMPFGIEKVICRRSIMELRMNDFINLGIGLPMNVSAVLNEEGHINDVSASIESGIVGGVPANGLATGAAYNPDAVLKQPDIFDFYDGGGIDFACLGAAQMDKAGNVNVSRFAGKTTGPGGFINITQGAKLICFLGTFTAGKQDIRIEDGKINIIKDGPYIKFKEHVEHITFSGEHSRSKKEKQTVFYITERAVFKLTEQGLTLIEIAPGVDLEKDILDKMEFVPAIAENLKVMDSRLFRLEKMNITIPAK